MSNSAETTNLKDYPLLSGIDSPADLRRLSQDQLPEVAAELRRFLIESLAENPGHFASSMGAVDLTVALHYVFNTPYDRIVWDVGHQAYAHKILTGRRDSFHTLRRHGGISGFPNPAESQYDTFSTGHASNSISAALGMSVAAQLAGIRDRHVVAVIGDASIAGGLAFEALNNAANSNANVLIILNDNDMSIDRPTGSLNSYLAHITSSKAYNNLRYQTSRALKKLHLVTDRQRGFIMRFNNSLKSLITRQQNIFEGLNIRYFGPFDGHDINRIVRVLNDIKDLPGPRLLHLRTIKGKGFGPAESDPATWHAPGRYEACSGQRLNEPSEGRPPKFQQVMGSTLVELARTNPKIVAITAAMPSGTSVNLMGKAYPERTFDVGISEGHAVTFAGGLAKDGMLPYVAIYSSFLQRAYDSIINDIGIQQLPVTFCIDRAGLVGEDGVTHHGTFDMAYLRPVPGMTIAAPRNEDRLRDLLYTSQLPDRTGPWAIRYPRGRGLIPGWKVNAADFHKVTVGKGSCLRPGRDVAILSLGPIVTEALSAADALARTCGISVAVYDMEFLKPLDTSLLREAANLDCPLITLEDGTINGGLGSAVSEWLATNDVNRRLIRLGNPDDRFVEHGSPSELHHDCHMDAEAIMQAVNSSLSNR